ncbi:putative diguanylate cyclase YdaM [Rubripirellula amarantea]|uniref:diguanylate cyclase n=1 Tax=Rubripirellula amarantea TaxID=2527999 RepID=A0A5C5WRC4_9BACT|nr:GGDEF domain-containing protein [Rubripirellula amarantea]TWT52729.1 putative diguanylate cyclase YdaM [Rubripirellula amarantea]
MIWLDYFIPLSCGGGGVACGWVMNALSRQGAPPNVPRKTAAAELATESVPVETMEAKQKRIAAVAEQLQSYAKTMAADVDAHQTRVKEVNHTLTNNQTQAPEAVLEAIHELIASNETMQNQLQDAHDRIHEQALQIESAERRAETDALTRVANRAAFDKHLQSQHALGTGKAGSLAMLDVDHFKKFNDVYGHRAGDEVLRVVAGMMHSRLNKHGLVARYGGEEFAIILDGKSLEEASLLVESARMAISQREILFEGKRLRVTASVGVAALESDESIEQWVQRADDGLYRSKEKGRDCGHSMKRSKATLIQAKRISNLASPDQAPERESASIEAASIDLDDVFSLDDDEMIGGSEGEQASKNSPPSDPSTSETVAAGPLASLPNHNALRETFEDILKRAQTSASMSIMAISCNGPANSTTMRSLVQIVRATLRSVDRLGYENDSTLLVCMPSVDPSTAQARGLQICRSAGAVGIKQTDTGENMVSVGIAPAAEESDFEEIVRAAMDMSVRGRVPGMRPVVFADAVTTT